MQVDRVAFEEVKRRLVGGKGIPRKIQKWTSKIKNELGVDLRNVKYEELEDDVLNVIFSRLYLKTITNNPIPKSKKDQGDYWKEFWNTSQGKGTPSRFVNTVK